MPCAPGEYKLDGVGRRRWPTIVRAGPPLPRDEFFTATDNGFRIAHCRLVAKLPTMLKDPRKSPQ
jgi:hypothetical protein